MLLQLNLLTEHMLTAERQENIVEANCATHCCAVGKDSRNDEDPRVWNAVRPNYWKDTAESTAGWMLCCQTVTLDANADDRCAAVYNLSKCCARGQISYDNFSKHRNDNLAPAMYRVQKRGSRLL